MPAAREEQQVDSLANLEERIGRAVEMVVALRKENQDLSQRLQTMTTERDEARTETQTAVAHSEKLTQEMEELRSERKQVRTRIEKLLGQMDLLSAT
jgi:FtsZ-binding cell division protein ZapB